MQTDEAPKNKGLRVAGEHGAEPTESLYGHNFLLAKIREKQGYSESVRRALNMYDAPKPPAAPTVGDILGPGGIIARALEGYESRQPQIEMAQTVAKAIKAGEHCIVEAGTGTGKSLAYLIPAIYSRKKTIVSTGDKGLQEQLFRKDLPFLQAVLPILFKTAMLKGKSNYLCLDRYNQEIGEQTMVGRFHEFATVQTWLEATEAGDLEELPISLSPEMHGKLTASSDACPGKVCRSFADCWAERAKNTAAAADIVIVNHSLLALDAAIRNGTDDNAKAICDRDLVIVDEAHRLEDAATLAFTKEVSIFGVMHLLHDKQVKAAKADPQQLARIVDQAQEFFDELADLSDKQTYTLVAVPDRVQVHAENLSRLLYDLARILDRTALSSGTTNDVFGKFVERVRTYGDMVLDVLTPAETHVVYVEKRTNAKRTTVYLKRCPISVANDLREALFDKWPTICTSATIATGGGFAYLKARIGCDTARELIVGSPFDFKKNALIYVVPSGSGLDPSRHYQEGSPEYFDRLSAQIEQLVLASGGRAFCLFTSNKALNEVYERIAHRLQGLVLKQNEMPRPEMVRQFKENGRAILFGTRSFFEGVDVQGDALSLVTIDKVPFGAPDDPVYQARCDALKRESGDQWAWWNQLALPTAIITLKQGFGRLIRTKSDRGVVALLDERLVTKRYGTTVIRSLPPATVTKSLEAVRAFFETH